MTEKTFSITLVCGDVPHEIQKRRHCVGLVTVEVTPLKPLLSSKMHSPPKFDLLKFHMDKTFFVFCDKCFLAEDTMKTMGFMIELIGVAAIVVQIGISVGYFGTKREDM